MYMRPKCDSWLQIGTQLSLKKLAKTRGLAKIRIRKNLRLRKFESHALTDHSATDA